MHISSRQSVQKAPQTRPFPAPTPRDRLICPSQGLKQRLPYLTSGRPVLLQPREVPLTWKRLPSVLARVGGRFVNYGSFIREKHRLLTSKTYRGAIWLIRGREKHHWLEKDCRRCQRVLEAGLLTMDLSLEWSTDCWRRKPTEALFDFFAARRNRWRWKRNRDERCYTTTENCLRWLPSDPKRTGDYSSTVLLFFFFFSNFMSISSLSPPLSSPSPSAWNIKKRIQIHT